MSTNEIGYKIYLFTCHFQLTKKTLTNVSSGPEKEKVLS
ncbi:hypothetical protein Cha6605_2801 [Chamaesiphon minutus PCC 6605]|uniref:Uncharacterized protein n=1 Tax=Chamaesiphon minutus (strain ATCC 27169 / PCC 6605) TaxID=1173020 RepID=K9UGS3_CHAP6|nr:hypothetical protein Cha6605_2801 [Chamaesiphon minutus PCC 6605]